MKLTLHVRPATKEDAHLVEVLAKTTFIESHGHSAKKEYIDNYIDLHFNHTSIHTDLSNSNSIYHLFYYNDKPVGYSKIIINHPHPQIENSSITKLERLYLLKEFHGLEVGKKMFDFNLKLSKDKNQEGMWLFVWVKNHRALKFYQKQGFKIVGSHDFKISETHSNPNHIMLLKH